MATLLNNYPSILQQKLSVKVYSIIEFLRGRSEIELMGKFCSRQGISISGINVLFLIEQCEFIRAYDIAKKLNLSQMAALKIVRRLTSLGYLTRERDNRKVVGYILHLTENGKKFLEDVKEFQIENIAKFVANNKMIPALEDLYKTVEIS